MMPGVRHPVLSLPLSNQDNRNVKHKGSVVKITGSQDSSNNAMRGFIVVDTMEERAKGPDGEQSPEAQSRDRRQLIPKIGLFEYWYPVIQDYKIKPNKPMGLKMLGVDLVFFRDTNNNVKCLWNVCPHRGGSLADGDCHYSGYVSCPYHGWTFDGGGNLVAVLSEGPESVMPGKSRARAYPTQTHKGIVFVWMGEKEPAPIQEDVPEEIFEKDTLILTTSEVWEVNWAVALENSLDSHPAYLHRDSLRVMMQPLLMNGSRGTPLFTYPSAVTFKSDIRVGDQTPTYEYHFPNLGWRWPKHKYRRWWNWITRWSVGNRRRLPRFHRSDEWAGFGHHLPAMFRLDQRTDMYTRNCVPIDENTSRMFYYYATRPSNSLNELYKRIQWVLWHRWSLYVNFSKQDQSVMKPQRYDTPEDLSPTDIEVIALRKMLTRARGLAGSPENTDSELKAEKLVIEQERKYPKP